MNDIASGIDIWETRLQDHLCICITLSLKLTFSPPENPWLEDEFPFGARPLFRGEKVSFRGCSVRMFDVAYIFPQFPHTYAAYLIFKDMFCCKFNAIIETSSPRTPLAMRKMKRKR